MRALLLILAIVFSCLGSVATFAVELESKLRRPVALALSDDGLLLITANHASGSVSIIDTRTHEVVKEIEVGGKLSDIAMLDEFNFLALDSQNHQLVRIGNDSEQWQVLERVDVANDPVRLVVDKHGSRCFVSSLWSRTVTCIQVNESDQQKNPKLVPAKKVDLNFEPRELCFSPETNELVIGGAYSNCLAIIESNRMQLIAQKQFAGHNIAGLWVRPDQDQLLLTQQELHRHGRSTQDDVHWGNMITNQLVTVDLQSLRSPAETLRLEKTYLGEPGDAAGDPGGIHIDSKGQLAVLSSGKSEIMISSIGNQRAFQRIAVGQCPSDLLSGDDGTIYVANKYSDSISVIGDDNGVETTISLGPQPELSPKQLGETLFFDSRVSLDGWMSCHSCHTDGHSSGQLNDNLSDGSFNAAKRVLSLRGAGETEPWAWDGGAPTLAKQVERSVKNTMHGDPLSKDKVDALVAFMKSLPPAPPLLSESEQVDNANSISNGKLLFLSLECTECHNPPTYTSPNRYDVGLKDIIGNGRFNPPSLRGVGRRHSLLHDGSVKSLQELFSVKKHQLKKAFSNDELESLILFLQSL